MSKLFIRFIYNRYRKDFQNLFLADLFDEMPDKLHKPVIEMMGQKKETFLKWLYYEANAVARRSVVDFGGIERRNGILVMIQALILAISNANSKTEDHPILGELVKVPDDWKDGLTKFQEAAKERTEKETVENSG